MGKGSSVNTEPPGVEIIAGAPVYARDGEGTMVSLPYRRRSEDGVVTLLGVVNLRFNIVLPNTVHLALVL